MIATLLLAAALSPTPEPTPAVSVCFNPKTYVKPSDAELQKKLNPMQYRVTQHAGTEPAFQNEFAHSEKPGIYVDVVSGEPLFSSQAKYDSGTGWPSFFAPLEPDNIKQAPNGSLFYGTEVRSTHADSHLGHVFSDGPAPTGMRYCINSAALRFIPVDKLQAEGYGKYLPLFENKSDKKDKDKKAKN